MSHYHLDQHDDDWHLVLPEHPAEVDGTVIDYQEAKLKTLSEAACKASDLVKIQMLSHFPAASACESSTLMGMASLRVPGSDTESKLTQLDIVAVVDRSGSMSGQRIQLVKSAVSFMSRHLRTMDRLALVSYSDNASIDFSLTHMDQDGQNMCKGVLDSMTTGGQTNLGEALLWGLGELASSDAPVAALLLFTDGLANKGMIKTEEMVEAVQGPMSDMGRKSRAVFTMGFGTQHNAEMLFAIADAGAGCYAYVDTPAAIGPCFADVLGGMLSVAAQDVQLHLRAVNGCSISEVHADFPVDLDDDCTSARIMMRDLQGDTEKNVLFNVKIPSVSQPDEAWKAIECTVSFVDAASGTADFAKSALTLARLGGNAQRAQPDDTVESHRCRLIVVKAMEKAAKLAGTGACLAEAQAVLLEASAELERSPAWRSDVKSCSDRVRDLIADLLFCSDNSKDAATCVKWCSSKAFAHKYQTSASAEASQYRNALQEKLIQAARREISQAFSGEASKSHAKVKGAQYQGSVAKSNVTLGSSPDAIQAGALCPGMRVICQGKPGMLQDLSRSKTGKHGHAKVFFTVSCDDGVIRQDVVAAHQDVMLP